jgi:hypothetical protein
MVLLSMIEMFLSEDGRPFMEMEIHLPRAVMLVKMVVYVYVTLCL